MSTTLTERTALLGARLLRERGAQVAAVREPWGWRVVGALPTVQGRVPLNVGRLGDLKWTLARLPAWGRGGAA